MPSKVVVLSWSEHDGVESPVDPGFGVGGVRPPRPDNSLPSGGHISTLPVLPFDPTIDNTLPDGSQPPNTTLPIHPGMKLVVKWLCGFGLVAVPLPVVPPTPEPKV